MAEAARGRTWGAFTLGGLALALPLHALREVVPRTPLRPLPCVPDGVAGALEVRGVLVPVLDLCRLLGHAVDAQAAPAAVVVLAVHAGRLVGLLADRVDDVFDADPSGLHHAHGAAGDSLLFAGGLARPDGGGSVCVLDLAALAAWPGVPTIDDPEPARTVVAGDADDTEAAAGDGTAAPPMMLVRCGEVGLAIEATAVHAAIPQPRLEGSAVAGGACLGVLAWTGLRIPALDLLDLCGLGAAPREASRQALVLRVGEGHVALLIDHVVDVVRQAAGEIVALPRFGLARPELFAGTLPAAASRPFLVLDAAALRAQPLVASLAGVNVGDQDGAEAQGDPAAATAAAPEMLTYELGVEVATPLDQVEEILAYCSATEPLSADGALLDIVVQRGRSIPILCLSRLAGLAPPVLGGAARVLVVRSPHGPVGFAVPALREIDRSRGERQLPGASAGDATAQALRSGRFVYLGQGAGQRGMPLVDLRGLADSMPASAA